MKNLIGKAYKTEKELFLVTKLEPFENNRIVITREVVDAKGKYFTDTALLDEDQLSQLCDVDFLDFAKAKKKSPGYQLQQANKTIKDFAAACALDIDGLVFTVPFVFSIDAILYIYHTIKRTAAAAPNADILISEISLTQAPDGVIRLEVGDVTPGGASAFGASLYAISEPRQIEKTPAPPVNDELAAGLIKEL